MEKRRKVRDKKWEKEVKKESNIKYKYKICMYIFP